MERQKPFILGTLVFGRLRQRELKLPFKTHDVVALGESDHGNEHGAAFRAKLYCDPRFQAVVNHIVVESGNGRHQAMMDRYIAGETVPAKELRMAWLETTQPDDPALTDNFRNLPR